MARILTALAALVLGLTLAPAAMAASPPAPPPAAAASPAIDGEWDGTLNLGPGGELRLAFHLKVSGASTFDSPDQGVYGAPVSSVAVTGRHVRIESSAVAAVLEGDLSADGQFLPTIFKQGSLTTGLLLKRLPPGAPSPWPAPASPVAAKPPENWTTPTDAEIRKILADRIDTQKQATGIVVGVITPEGRRVIAYGAFGRHNPTPVGADTLFEIGSVTKVFTSVILADMVRRGEVALDDPIAKYLPPGVAAPAHGARPITLADLATHTSGLPRMPTNFAPKDPENPYADYTDKELYAFVGGYALTRDPGTQWDYSNLGVGLLGELLARRAGVDYPTLVRTRVLEPLHMTSTVIALSPANRARLAPGHDSRLAPAANWDLVAFAGAGALRSDANDMLTFLAAEMGLTATPLKADMDAALAVRRRASTDKVDQALGWQVIKGAKGEIVTHSGGTGGYRTFVGFDPKTRVGVVVLANAATVSGPDDIGFHILRGTPVGVFAPPPPPPPQRSAVAVEPKVLDGLVGTYELAPGATMTVTREGAKLMAQLTGQPAYEIFPESPTRFFWKVVDAQADFTVGADGKATSLTLHQAGRDMPGKRLP